MIERATALSHAARGLVFSALLAAASGALASHVGEELQLDQQAVASTDQLLATLRLYERTPAPQRAALAAQLTQLAQQRQSRMLALIDANPGVAALRVLPQSVRSRLPAGAQAFVEQPVMIRGAVTATVEDDFARGHSRTRLQIADAAGQRFELRSAQATDRERLGWVGKRGAVTAMRFDQHLLVVDKRNVQLLAADGSTSTQATSTAAAVTAVQGVQNTLVVMLNFTDKAITCTPTDLQNRLFGSSGATMNEGYRQSSGNLVSFTGQVIGPFNTSYSSTGACDPNGWASAANAAAVGAGFNPSAYQRVSYATPASATCGWTGLASLGGSSPTPSWIQSCGSTGVFSHELGHNLKFHHASTPTSEYGDSSDPMGAAMLVQSNAANRVMAGWVSGGQLQDVSTSGSYAIQALENMASSNPLVLRMPKPDTGEAYYVSLRQGLDLDANLPSGYKGALSVHRATGTLPAQTFRVANLTAGQSWTDSINGITVTHQGLTATGASVGVAIGGASCARLAPTVAVAPASQTAAPGATLAYALTVTNNNSAACSSSTFNLTQSLPAGFTGSLGAASVVLGSGASANVGWNIASSTSSVDATYTSTAAASEATVANSANAHASYVVLAPTVSPPPPPPPEPTTDTAPPTLTITNPAPNVVLSGRNVTLAATATDASGVAAVEFYVNDKRMSIDTSAPFTANWNLRKAGKGNHSIRVRALDTLNNAAEQTITVTVN